MLVLKCKTCGGVLDVREGMSIIKCEYCGNMNTLPKEKDTDNYELFARANDLRLKCEFDTAERLYEKILEKSPQEAEAYWGLVLCEYGIEYVEDPKTGKRVPTCHRASYEAIVTDYNYKKAIEYADGESRPIYESDARTIDAIQKEILALSLKKEKYDVFICYKETDENGKRTEDSVIANDIYYELTQKGYEVFYAAITLEEKIGQDYEPIIFAALNSAKVMLVVGTKKEYFNSVWVKNEWSRFLKIMKKDRSKMLFPCYKNMSAYDLPDEFNHMQAQDMGKIGFINDLVRGIKKIIVKEKPKKEVVVESKAEQTTSNKTNPKLRRAYIFLEDENWSEADEYFEKVLDEEPENTYAYLGKLLVDLKVRKQEELADLSQTFDTNPNYKKVYRFADEALKGKLIGYNEAIINRNEEKSKNKQYSLALTQKKVATTEEDYRQAARKFGAILGWKDSASQEKECLEKAEEARKSAIYDKAFKFSQSNIVEEIEKAIPLFESISDWKDSADKAKECAKKAERLKNNAIYDKALKFSQSNIPEEIKKAIPLFKSISDWKDSANKAKECEKKAEETKKDAIYDKALKFSQSNIPEEIKRAIQLFESIPDWKDSISKAKECFDRAEKIRKNEIYNKAIRFTRTKNVEEIKRAIPLFESILDWKDSAEMLEKIPELCTIVKNDKIYEDALKKLNGTSIEKIKEAQAKFLSIANWKDSTEKAELCLKRIQKLKKEEREREIALKKKKAFIKKVSIISGASVVALIIVIVLLTTLIIPTTNFNKATELLNSGKYEEAMDIYQNLDGFGNSDNKVKVIKAISYIENGNYRYGIRTLLENGATVTISYDCAGGELSNLNTASVRDISNQGEIKLMSFDTLSADESSNNSFTYNNANEFDDFKPTTRNGYKFKKWNLVECKPEITKETDKINLTFVAEWEVKSYTISYNLGGGIVNGENVIGYNTEDEDFKLINPTRIGYTFMGWTGTDLSENTMEVTVASGSYGNRSYTANWQANTYTVTYDANGGTAAKIEDIATYDKEFTLATVERKGYTFRGWFSGTTKYEDFDNWECTEGLNLKAEWQINKYSITYTLNGGIVTNIEEYTVEDTVIINAPEKIGYIFDGWTGTGLSEKTKSITLAKGTIGDKNYIADWTAKTYTVTFNANGGTASKLSDTATYDSNFTLAMAERTGYDFIGWKADNKIYSDGDWQTDKNVELVAEWKIVDYTLSYNLDGGSVDGTNPATYTIEDTVTLINPTRSGYTFAGWTGTDLSGKTMSVTIAKVSIGARSYTANWTANEYTLSFNVNGGDALASNFKTVVYDSSYSVPVPTRRGYDFVEWKTSMGVVYNGGKWKTAGNVIVIAQWNIIDYAISCNLDGGSVAGNNLTTYTVEDTITLKNPTRTGYTFTGWTGTDLSSKTMTVTIAKGSVGARSYTANWTANTYELTYDVNGGNALANNKLCVTYDASYSVVEPTRTGYTFVKWATSTGTVYSGGTWKTDDNVTLIAEWKANTYTVNYNGNGGTPAKTSDTATYDKTFTLSTASRTGYEFVCWKYNGEEFTSGKWNLTKDITLVADWSPLSYTITYVGNDGTPSQPSQIVTYDTSPTLATASRTGYNFKGWFDGTKEYISGDIWKTANDVILIAEWEARTDTVYTVRHHQQNIYDDDYTVFATDSLKGKSDASITPTVNTYTGFTSPKATTTTIAPDGNRVIDYYYTRNSYTITLITNGGTGSSITQKFESSLDKNSWSTREGFTFGGWFADKILATEYTLTSMPAENQTIYAWWSEENKPTDFSYSGTSVITVSAYNGNKKNMVIPAYIGGKPVTTIGKSAFSGKTTIISVIMPDTITTIGDSAFYNCSSMVTLKLSNTLRSIPEDMCQDCHSLGEIDIPNSVISIGSYAFEGCEVLKKVVLGEGITDIYYCAFYNANNIEEVYIANLEAFCNITYLHGGMVASTPIGTGALLYVNDEVLTDLVIPESITEIKDWFGFRGYDGLKSITFHDKITYIGSYAFEDCANLEKINLGRGVKTIGRNAFSNCTKLSIVTGGENLERIDFAAFHKCTSLTSFVIGEKMAYIGVNAFYGCSNMTSVTFKDYSIWYVSSDTKTQQLSEDNLRDVSTAAKYLRSSYVGYTWEKE